jgi:cell division protease FtsH
MNLKKSKKKEILKKKEKLEELKIKLKDDFVGIDNIIDDVVSSISPFYLFPESIKRPIVVNLWGMTGTGKTSLIESVVEFLKQKHCFVKFDVGEYCDSDDKLKKELATKIKKVNGNRSILLFDEFQLGRTIDETGKEIDRNSLRPIWELIDSGIIYTHNSGIYMGLVDLIDKIKKCLELGVEVDKDGYVVKKEDVYDSLFKDEYGYVPYDYKECYVLDGDDEYSDGDVHIPEISVTENANIEKLIDELEGKETKKKKKKKNKEEETPNYVNPLSTNTYWWTSNKGKFKKPRFIKRDMFESFLYDATPSFFSDIKDFDVHKHMFEKSLPQLLQFLQNDFLERIELTKKVNFSQSIIFCVGNLDELYRGEEHNVSPDEDADLFHENSLDITLPQVKDALASRFRMEQIGRLGNTHFIYHTLNKKSYEKLITKYLKSKSDYIKETFNLEIDFKKSVHEVLYSEGVYPSQGTRPLLSTFNSMIESYVTNIITELSVNFDKAETIDWSYKNQNYKLIVKDSDGNKKTYNYPVECKLEKLRNSDSSELQALVAVHESGHALVSCLTTKVAPTEVLSKTADLSEGVCKHNYKDLIYTKDFLIKELQILLAGIEAEKFVFGEDFCTIGAGSDLSSATNLAFNIVKRYGMDKYPALMSSDGEADMSSVYVKDDSGKLEEKVLNLLKDAKKSVQKMLKDNEEHLLLLSNALIEKAKIVEEEVKEILSDLDIEWKEAGELYKFKNTVAKRLKKYEKKHGTDFLGMTKSKPKITKTKYNIEID